jgi:SAM-dependent methyltransferase
LRHTFLLVFGNDAIMTEGRPAVRPESDRFPVAGLGGSGVPQIHFDERIAATYDADSAAMFDPVVVTATVDFLEEVAGGRGGTALELGIGTGRIALPLWQRGVAVHGIDVSRPMVAQLAAKERGSEIPVTIGDFAAAQVPGAGAFRLVYLVFNTIMNLTTQDEQVGCFANAAAHLAPGGAFVVEVVVPDLRHLPPGQTVRPFAVEPGYVAFEEFTDLTESQIAYSHHYRVVDGKLDVFSAPYRYVWPSELDLMARLAGLALRERWAGWRREPFTGDSPSHVSVWEERPAG